MPAERLPRAPPAPQKRVARGLEVREVQRTARVVQMLGWRWLILLAPLPQRRPLRVAHFRHLRFPLPLADHKRKV